MIKEIWACLFLLFNSLVGYSQLTNSETYGIQNPGKEVNKSCKDLYNSMASLPKEVRASTKISDDSVYIILPDPLWVSALITSKKDGLAIDLVSKDIFSCANATPPAKSSIHTGYLMPPLNKLEIERRIFWHPDEYILINMGALPPQFQDKEIEANYLIIKDKNLCHYTNIVNIDFSGWELLKTGLYYDTLSSDQLKGKFKDVSKSLVFTIPFEKDKYQYKKEDIKPLYDSLNMTDYTIKSINIKAYTSVEGQLERNLVLQNQRAESIVKALQSYQNEKMESTISADENWVEFLSDIATSPYSNYLSLSKAEIKEKLKSQDLLNKLEPLLSRHRKAIIELELEKRLSFQESNPVELKKYFKESISKYNLDEALYLQKIIFYKIKKEEIPEQFIGELEIPETIEFGRLLINNAAFQFENDYDHPFEAVAAFKKLEILLPKSKEVKYNLAVLKMRAWLRTELLEESDILRKEIEALRGQGIADPLVRRLLINYYIILSEIKMQKKDYVAKDKAMQFIYNTYSPLKLKDDDLVNLAKYFSYYSKFDWSIQALLPRVNKITASDDLLFYYLSLTIYNPKYTSNKYYRTSLLNAISKDKQRFCSLFNSIEQGGVSFQLLSDPYLKKTYCENCSVEK